MNKNDDQQDRYYTRMKFNGVKSRIVDLINRSMIATSRAVFVVLWGTNQMALSWLVNQRANESGLFSGR